MRDFILFIVLGAILASGYAYLNSDAAQAKRLDSAKQRVQDYVGATLAERDAMGPLFRSTSP